MNTLIDAQIWIYEQQIGKLDNLVYLAICNDSVDLYQHFVNKRANIEDKIAYLKSKRKPK